MTDRENFLGAARFTGCDCIPAWVSFSPATWARYRGDLEAVLVRHPALFGPQTPGSRKFDDFGPAYRQGERYTDNWGCVWENIQAGLEGQVVVHPLADYAALATYRPPDQLLLTERGTINWADIEARVAQARANGQLVRGGVERFYERLHFLRGFENLMMDFVLDPPELHRMIQMVIEANLRLIRRWLHIGVDIMHFCDDLGLQDRLMMSPAHWRKYLGPGYAAMFQPCRKAGSEVYLHSDGHLLSIIDDLIKCGVTILNPQSRANGIDNLAVLCKGRLCLALDLDRQWVLPFGSPADVRDHVKEAVMKLGSPAGGLMLGADVNPDVPLANVEAVCSAIEEFREYWKGRTA